MSRKPGFRSSQHTLSTELQDLFVVSQYSADNFSERFFPTSAVVLRS